MKMPCINVLTRIKHSAITKCHSFCLSDNKRKKTLKATNLDFIKKCVLKGHSPLPVPHPFIKTRNERPKQATTVETPIYNTALTRLHNKHFKVHELKQKTKWRQCTWKPRTQPGPSAGRIRLNESQNGEWNVCSLVTQHTLHPLNQSSKWPQKR